MKKTIIFLVIFLTILTLCLMLTPMLLNKIQDVIYSTKVAFCRFDHIECDGEAFYFSEINIPDNYFSGEETVEVVIVNKNGDPYDDSRTETGYVFINESDGVKYVLFDSFVYTNDKSLALKERYNFND